MEFFSNGPSGICIGVGVGVDVGVGSVSMGFDVSSLSEIVGISVGVGARVSVEFVAMVGAGVCEDTLDDSLSQAMRHKGNTNIRNKRKVVFFNDVIVSSVSASVQNYMIFGTYHELHMKSM